MDKEFIPYQPSLDMKELGFDEPCFGRYNPDNDLIVSHTETYNTDFRKTLFTQAPTFSQAFRWFREKYNYNHSIVFTKHPFGTDEYQYMILLEDDECVEINFKTYEEAELACLKKLIEIVKNK
jgi:hypothetical protein